MKANNHKLLNKVIAIIIIVVLVIIAIPILYFYIWFKVGINNLKKQHNKNIEIELQNRDDNIKIFNEYIKNRYGTIIDTFEITIKSAVVNTNTLFVIKTPFMDQSFGISVDTKKKRIDGDTFYEVLSKDMKFQHMYSEWVKRQIGCEDENVELGFYGQQSNPKLIILFNQISNLNNNYEEIFKNTYNFYLNTISIKHLRDLNEQNSYDIAIMETSEYVNRIKKMIGTPPFKFSYGIRLSNNEFLKEDVNIFYRCNYKDNSKLERSKW